MEAPVKLEAIIKGMVLQTTTHPLPITPVRKLPPENRPILCLIKYLNLWNKRVRFAPVRIATETRSKKFILLTPTKPKRIMENNSNLLTRENWEKMMLKTSSLFIKAIIEI